MVQRIRLRCQDLIVNSQLGNSGDKIGESGAKTGNPGSSLKSVQEQKNQDQESNNNEQEQKQDNMGGGGGVSSFQNAQENKDSMMNQDDLNEDGNLMEDDFVITLDDAQKFNQQTNMMDFIRQNILSQNQPLFILHLDEFKSRVSSIPSSHLAYIDPNIYAPEESDVILMKMVIERGFDALENIQSIESNHPLAQKGLTSQKCYQRIDWICQTFKDIKERAMNAKKRKADKIMQDDPKKQTKFEISRDGEDQIIFPLQINASLRLLSLGRINPSPAYHSQHNLFPVGYCSARTHSSMFTRGTRCEYTCQILQGPDNKPLYRVTSQEDPEHPIVRESSTGCWVYIYQKVNNLQEVKKEKVTISGTQRFGLLQNNVSRLLEDLPGAELCTKYKFKCKNVGQNMLDL